MTSRKSGQSMHSNDSTYEVNVHFDLFHSIIKSGLNGALGIIPHLLYFFIYATALNVYQL